MNALYDEERRQLVRLSLMMICGGAAVLPMTVPPTSLVARAQSAPRYSEISVPSVPTRLEFPVISVARDPFMPDIATLTGSTNSMTTGMTVRQDDDIAVVLPPNAGAESAVAPSVPDSTLPIVRGIVLGEEPQVLVEIGGTVKVLGIGDAIGGLKITTIDGSGVTLSNGARVKLASGAQ